MFKQGDIVTLRSGSLRMTVVDTIAATPIPVAPEKTVCSYFNPITNTFISVNLPSFSLKKAV